MMQNSKMKYEGRCNCGAVRIGILTDPIMAYSCHCSHCRAFGSKYANEPIVCYPAAFVWKWSVRIMDGDIEYESSTGVGGLFSLQRGRCVSCKQPIWERGGRLAVPYAMVSIPPLQGLQPDTNIYYDSGLKQGTRGMKTTIYSDTGSLLYEIWLVVTIAIPQLPALIWTLWKNRTTSLSEKKKST